MVEDVQYLTDATGRKTAVVMPFEKYKAMQELLEDLYLAKAVRDSKDEPTRPFEDFVAEMRAAGEIDV